MNIGKTSRAQLVLAGLFVVLGIFIIRLFVIQVVQHEKYVAEANAMQISKNTIQPERGQIYVRDGTGVAPLVLNEPVYTVFADPQEVKDAEKVKSKIREIAGGEAVNESFNLLSDQNKRYVVLAKQVSRAQAEKIREADLAGVGLQAGTRRVYPEGGLAAQTIGFVNNDGVGQYGVEQYMDEQLKGTPGVLQSVTDVRRIPLTIGQHDVRVPAKNGENVVLTLDRNIQAQAETFLKEGLDSAKATKGSMVVMDPQTGKIIAMANYPSYDPSQYTKVEDGALFQNNIVSNPYEAGSVIKLLTMGAGMDAGVVSRDSQFYNTGCVMVDDAKICNVLQSGTTGRNNSMTEVLQYSLNTGVIWVLEQMGGGQINLKARQTLYDYYTGHYKFNQRTGIQIAGEAPGTVIAPDDPSGARVRYSNMAFGQGMDVTMIQVVSAFSAAINGGKYYQPQVIDGTLDAAGNEIKNEPKLVMDNVLKPDVSENLKDMLYLARYKGLRGNVIDNGHYVGGKTGTSQTIDPATGRYTDAKTIGTYIGFGAGSDHVPKYAIMVRVDDAGTGSSSGSVDAAPIFANMSNWMINYMGLEP